MIQRIKINFRIGRICCGVILFFLIQPFNGFSQTQRDSLVIPAAFSPNGDGRDDLFTVEGINTARSVEFNILTRWGNEVFGANKFPFVWDGSDEKGNKLPAGSYYYLLSYKDESGEEILRKGIIQISR